MEEILNQLRQINQKLDKLKTDDSLEEALDVEEIAKILKCSENKVYNLWANKELGYVPVGTRKVSTPEQVKKYIKENSVESVEKPKFKNNITAI